MIQVDIHPLKIDQLENSDKILLPSEIAEAVSKKVGRREFTVVNIIGKDSCVLEVLRTNENRVRIGFTLRTLLEWTPDCQVQLSLPTNEINLEDKYLKSPLRKIWRKIDSAQEELLALSLGSPTSIFKTRMTNAGDDDRYLVRMHPSLFPRLGINPGDHVFVERAGRKIVAIAFEEQLDESFQNPSGHVKSQAVGKDTRELPEDFPLYLIMRVSPQAREALGISKRDVNSIVRVRRRVRTKIVSEFNKMILPIVLLLLGINPSGLNLITKVAIVIIVIPSIILVGLAPLKIRRTPKGLWNL